MQKKRFIHSALEWIAKIILFFLILAAGLLSFEKFDGEEVPIFHHTARQPLVRLLFVGDMMFDRQARITAGSKGDDYVFSCADDTLRKYDAVVGNLEGPITHNDSLSQGSVVGSHNNYVFTFPLATPKLLLRHNIQIVNLGNNHILNFGTEGLKETREALDASGVGYFGGVRGSTSIYRKTFGGRPFSFVNFNEFGGDSATTTAAEIVKEKVAGNTVILYAHWGDEYMDVPDRVREWTNLFLGSGADAVIGSHPHVVQGWGTVNGKPYYYSLGNFIFDQYWSADVSNGLAVEMVFDGPKITTKEFNVHIGRDGRSCIATE